MAPQEWPADTLWKQGPGECRACGEHLGRGNDGWCDKHRPVGDPHPDDTALRLADLLDACAEVEKLIQRAVEQCAEAQKQLAAIRAELGTPVVYEWKRHAVSLGPLDPNDPTVRKMIENGDIEPAP